VSGGCGCAYGRWVGAVTACVSTKQMICLSGVDAEQDAGARVLQEAVQKIVRIKLQMGSSVSNEALEH
jgi:hypothetical protein